ncbi:MAG: ribokinase [Treponema sp.]|nr:ribokinase [Treponema sp.]
MKILVYGSLNIDMVFMVDHIVRPGETIAPLTLEKSAGGKGANQAAALAKAGMDVYLAGKIGEDGRFLLELLNSYGVNTEKVIIYPGVTGQAIIQLDRSKQNSILLYAGGNGEIQEDEIDGVLASFSAGDAVLLQNEIPHAGVIIKKAKERGMKIYLNPSPFDDNMRKLPMELVDIFFVNEIEAAALASAPGGTALPCILDQLAKNYPEAEIILTAGEDGAYYGTGTIREKGEIVRTRVADTTGAGDTFTGYYIAARESRFPVAQALGLACKAAAIAVSRKGAMQSIPFKEEVF